MARKKKTPLAVGADGRLFVEIKAIMSPLCAFIDGLTIHQFPPETRTYLEVDDAIAWCKKEMEHHSRERFEKSIAVLERFKVQESGRKTT